MATLQEALLKAKVVDPDVARYQQEKQAREERLAAKGVKKEPKPRQVYEVTVRTKVFIEAENADQVRALATEYVLDFVMGKATVAVNPAPVKDKQADYNLNEGKLVAKTTP